MQNLNDLEKRQQGSPQMPVGKQISSQIPPHRQKTEQSPSQSADSKRRKMSKYEKFVYVVFVIILLLFTLVGYIFIIKDDMKAREQIQSGYEKAKNSSKVQEYRAQKARRQRELAKQRRLKELGINSVTEPYQKNDLLNERLREQKIAEEQESLQTQDLPDYTKELAAYNAKLAEVKAEEARLAAEARAQAEARAKNDAEIRARMGIKE